MKSNMNVGNGGIWNIVQDFYIARAKFNSFYERHKEGKDTDFREFFDFVEESMEPLRESTHEKFRPDDIYSYKPKHQKKIDLEKDLFDMIIGELYHETEDLRSAIHQARDYKPRLSKHQEGDTDKIESDALEIMRKYIEAAEGRIPRKYKEVKELFDDATNILEQKVLPIYNQDMHLLKSMIMSDKPSLLDKDKKQFFFENGVDRLPHIFQCMYEDGEFEAYYTAGISWVNTGHIGSAVESFTRALDKYEERKDDPGFVQRNKSKLIKMFTLKDLERHSKLNERIASYISTTSVSQYPT